MLNVMFKKKVIASSIKGISGRSQQINLPESRNQILQINAYFIRFHALAGANCFSDLLGVCTAILQQ